MDDPNVDLQKLHTWALGLVTDGRHRRRAHEAQWWENIATFAGDLWVEYNLHAMKLEETPKPDHKVRLPINLAQPAVRTEYAKLLKNRPIVNTLARSRDKSDLNAADVGDKMLNDYGEQKFHKAKIRRRVLQWVLVTGLGGIFVDYDPTSLGEIEVLVGPDNSPVFDPTMIKAIQRHYRDKHKKPKTQAIPQGDLRLVHLSPFEILWDFSQLYIEDAAWCIVTEVFDVDEVYRRWGAEVQQDTSLEPGVIERRMMQRADLSGKLTLSPTRSQNLCEIHRMFIKPGHRYFKQGAEIVFSDQEIINSTVFPHTHGELPVSMMGHIFFPITQYPMSVLQQIRPVVLEISKTESQMIENRNLVSNPPWLEFRQNRIEGEIQNKPGMRLKVDFVPGVPEPHPIQMPDLPQYVKDLPELLGQHVLEITGQNETSQGQVPPGARSGVAIAYLTEENDTKLGPTVQEFEEMIERASGQELQMYAQYYDAPRTIRIYRKHSDPEVFDFIGTVLEGTAGVHCQAGSALPRSLAAKQQFTLDLYDRGLIRNPRQVMEMLDLGQGERDEWETDMDQAERENRKMQLGTDPGVQEWYNHQAHLYVHHQFMKSADFEELDPQLQQIFIEHEAEHQNFIASQQQAQMRQGLMQQGAPNGNGPAQAGPGQNQPGPQGAFSSPDDIGQVSQGANQQDYQPQ